LGRRSKQHVSLDGGVGPVRGAVDNRSYYRRGQEILSVWTELEPEFRVSAVQSEIELPRQGIIVTGVRNYDVVTN